MKWESAGTVSGSRYRDCDDSPFAHARMTTHDVEQAVCRWHVLMRMAVSTSAVRRRSRLRGACGGVGAVTVEP